MLVFNHPGPSRDVIHMHVRQECDKLSSLFPYIINPYFYFSFANLTRPYLLNHNFIIETFYIYELAAFRPLKQDQS